MQTSVFAIDMANVDFCSIEHLTKFQFKYTLSYWGRIGHLNL